MPAGFPGGDVSGGEEQELRRESTWESSYRVRADLFPLTGL